ncbi:MAG: DUF1289 domain-containing protein [Sphingomonadaceae bacterium]
MGVLTTLRRAMSIEPSRTALPELASPVPSPCVSLCKMDEDREYCLGCKRTIEEIIQWSKADDDYKRSVWAAIRRREQVLASGA